MLTKSLILLLAFATLVHCDGRLRFMFYYGSTATNIQEFNSVNFHTILNSPNFIRTRPTIMFHYGEGQTLATPQIHDIIVSYTMRGTYNFIVVHYDDIATVNTDNANALAAGISQSLINLFDNGYSSGMMNLLGFGLGAQIIGRSSRQVQGNTGRRHIIGRLTGLDPWSLGPINAITIGRVSSADAQWVETVHTEGNQRGDHESRGHVQFFLNGGIEQPHCTQISPIARWDCSHNFALVVWAESVRATGPTFPALSCDTWELFTSGACNANPVSHMGRTSEATLRGPYHLRTNMQSPWSRNVATP